MTTDLAVFDEQRAVIAEYKKENASLIFDYEDPQGNKDARSHIYKLRQAKTKIAEIHKLAKAEAWGVCKSLDREKNTLTGDVDEMIDFHYKHVKEIEERKVKAAAVKANEERLERIRIEAERTAEREQREEELATKEAALKEREAALIREQKNMETAKQADLDKQAAVKVVHVQAERDMYDALAVAETEKQAAVEAEQEKAQQEVQRIKDEAVKIAADLVAKETRIKVEALAKQEREAKIEVERVADEKHRASVESEVRLSLFRVTDDDEMASLVLNALINDEIAFVTINY